MEFRVNNLFKQWVADELEPEKLRKCEYDEDLLGEEIVIIDECYYFKAVVPRNGKFLSDKYLIDRTGRECFYNKLHIDNISNASKPKELIECGLYFAWQLAKKIEVAFGHGFYIILSYDHDSCVIRFHKKRSGENWLTEDLDGYSLDAILLIIT